MDEQFVIWGTEGSVKYTDGTLTIRTKDEPQARTIPADGDDGDKLRAFFDAVREDREPAVPPKYGLRVVALTEAAYQSRTSGRQIDIRELVARAKE